MTVSEQFNASRLMTTTLASTYGTSTNDDSHMMKNMEWGAVAYLSSSIYGRYANASTCISSGCEVWINNNENYTTGCAGSSVSASSASTCNAWNTATGVNASTTGNIYGIYDMSGGADEYVMGNYNDTISSAGFSSMPEAKYYDKYTGTDSNSDFTKYHLGDATKETLKTKSTGGNAWYGDWSYSAYSSLPWVFRGGFYDFGTDAGVFSSTCHDGNSSDNLSFRVVLGAL
ncbi:unknown [Coprobacillus sp. CAG:605]|nr:unknown [Coprobacillus sp. CAG:605]